MDYAQQNRPERGLGAHERERRSRAMFIYYIIDNPIRGASKEQIPSLSRGG